MTEPAFTLFDTPVGSCAVAWSTRGIAGVQLPEGNATATRARVLQQFPGARESAAPYQVSQAIDAIVSLLRGEHADLSAIRLDMDRVAPFDRRVYEAARTIPPGSSLSYGEVARRMGAPGAARAVGQALGRNPFTIIIPCHRVLAAGGKLGGFSANGGRTTKARLLAIEGARLTPPATAASRRSASHARG
jgi:methylated-DNA-[protein]-cysteine S-methyltransferase